MGEYVKTRILFRYTGGLVVSYKLFERKSFDIYIINSVKFVTCNNIVVHIW